MARIEGRATVETTVTLALTEEEAGALDALVGYGVEPFLKAFYPLLGEAYLKPYEKGLRSLFESVRSGEGSVSSFLQSTKNARDVFYGRKRAVELLKAESRKFR
jgi:hypothetical protein